MIGKPFDQIDKSDIERLISDGVRESRAIEYKLQLPGRGREEKREFLEDISAFANASGGYLIYGIEEEKDDSDKNTGLPKKALGLAPQNIDDEILYRQNIVRDGIAPRIRIQIKPIEGFEKGPILLFRIEQSWNGPHMLSSFKTRFFARNSAGKQPLDVTEIRAAFNLSESLGNRINDFRNDRLSKIVANETPFPLLRNGKIVLHIVPLSSFSREQRIDVSKQASERSDYVHPIYGLWSHRRFNFDGFVVGHEYDMGLFSGYAQVFRFGVIEAVDAQYLRVNSIDGKIFPIIAFQEDLIHAITKYFSLLSFLETYPPIIVFLSLLGVKGFLIKKGRSANAIEKDLLTLPNILVDNLNQDVGRTLRPLLDVLWQSCGYKECPTYDEEGNYGRS